jgi:hypothetical protein
MWVCDCLNALSIISRVRRCERRHGMPVTEILIWRPRRSGIQSIVLGVSARYGLHPSASKMHRVDQRLMPFVCAAHRLIGRLTSGLGLPGRPMVCLSLDGVRFPAVCVQNSGVSFAAVVFQDQIRLETVSMRQIEEHGLLRRWPASVKYIATPQDIVSDALGITFSTGTLALIVERCCGGRE